MASFLYLSDLCVVLLFVRGFLVAMVAVKYAVDYSIRNATK